jgi:hypothetical protein
MTDEPPNIVIEQLRHIRAMTDKTQTKTLDIENHLIERRLQLASVVREDVLAHARLAAFESRIERIESRLGLAD